MAKMHDDKDDQMLKLFERFVAALELYAKAANDGKLQPVVTVNNAK